MAKQTLSERVSSFNMLQLPGQPISMHMGTSYLVNLVNDLWTELQKVRKERDNLAQQKEGWEHRALKAEKEV